MSDLREAVENLYRTESRRVFATLARLLGDLDRAEEATSDAFAAAIEQWAESGVPENPRAWLVSAGRFKAIDQIRRKGKFDERQQQVIDRAKSISESNETKNDEEIEDDRLRLIFTCCHPAIAPEVQVALTLREVCGLTTEEIARAFLIPPATLAQRLVRGKAKIRDAGIAVQLPDAEDYPQRLDSVLAVIYLVFTEGYSASSGASLTRADLSGEAIRLGRLLVQLLPDPEAMGLLALMMLQESRRQARATADGDIILLEDQDRGLWDRALIGEGRALTARSLASRRFGVYTIQAAIAAVHAESASVQATDWNQIVALYDALLSMNPSPVVELNRAVALAMRDGPAAGLRAIDAVLARGDLANYHLAHAARADLLRRLEKTEDAKTAYSQALSLAQQEPERRFLRKRLNELDSSGK